jgi:predicted unusual protein kinase regulating ubiquinone biosynthesis (AarF/ABC1/UbiB family)
VAAVRASPSLRIRKNSLRICEGSFRIERRSLHVVWHNAIMSSSPPDGAGDGAPVALPPPPEAPPADAPPVSRISRLARLGALAPRALPIAAEAVRKAIGSRRTQEEELEARRRLAKNAKKTAEAMLKTLGDMKGLPLKLGQMASYIDGLAPPGYEERFQRVLARLQQKAPPLSPEAAVRVVREDLDAHPREVFAEWEDEPFAAASIGQVHRAVTRGGDRVAVKVQYPGIDRAIENDLKSLSMLETMIAPIGRRYQSKETLQEIKSVFLAEIDYRVEAEAVDTFRRVHEDDRDVVIPRVHHSLSSKRVLTLELMGGVDYPTFCERAPQAARDAAGETLARFMFRALWGHGLLYADPHPGNYRFLGGGRVAFLDFGCHKRIAPALVTGMKRYVVAAQMQDWDEFYRACVDVLGYDPSDHDSFALYTEYLKLVLRPLLVDERFRYTKEFARESVAFLVRGGRKIVFKPDETLPNLPAPVRMPSDFTFVNRLQWGFGSVLAGLGAEANWRRIVQPWLHGPVAPIP